MERVCSIISGDELIKWNDRVDDLPILCRDTTITSKEEINTFVREVNNMKKAKGHQSIDIRTMAVIHMTSGSEIQICFGSRFSTTKNGVYFEDNPNLFEFVNEIIYSPHDFYYWAGKMTKYVLEHPE